jgi:hypothetical protein
MSNGMQIAAEVTKVSTKGFHARGDGMNVQ